MSMYLEAYAVERDENGEGLYAVAIDGTCVFNDEVETIGTLQHTSANFLCGGQDAPDTIIIRGHEYVLVAYPSG